MKYVAVFLLALLLVSPAAESARGAITITATVTDVSESHGRIITTKSLRDRYGRKIGWGNTVCWRLGNGSSQCLGTFVLPLGKLSVAGTRHNSAHFVFAVVGGTGYYVGSGGSLIADMISESPRRERLAFFLR